jgi:HlyD family secretion protein
MEKLQQRRLLLAAGIVVLLVVVLVWLGRQKPVPRVSGVVVVRRDVTAMVTTNGKVEAIEPAVIRARLDTFVSRILATEGRLVRQGLPLLKLDTTEAEGQLARMRQSLLEGEEALRSARAGGRANVLAQLEMDLRNSHLELERLRNQQSALERLVAKQAATRDELEQNKLALGRAEANAMHLAERKEELARQSKLEVETAQLQVTRARDEIYSWEEKVRQGELTAPIAGTLYLLPRRQGDYVHTGDVLAEIADLRSVRVRAFVDEPDLGEVVTDQPVEITWDALPNRSWSGRTEQVPKTVVPRATRIVAEVLCSVDNAGLELLPNTNINVRIKVRHADHVLVVPRGAVQSDGERRFVYVIGESALGVNSQVLHQRNIRVGIGNATTFEILEGLQEGEKVALPGDVDLSDGIKVKAVIQE